MMTINNDNKNQPDNKELLKKEASACGPGCGCHTGAAFGRVRWIVGAIVLIAAGALMARAVMKNNNALTDKTVSELASLPTMGKIGKTPLAGPVPAPDETPAALDKVAAKEIGALSDLNAVAANTDGVFVFLSGKNDVPIKAPFTQMRSAARTIEAQGRKIGLFTLKTGSRDYEQIALQTPVPGVIAMVKGRGTSAVSGDITESKLIQAFVAASSAGGCGPSSAGCGPAGCN